MKYTQHNFEKLTPSQNDKVNEIIRRIEYLYNEKRITKSEAQFGYMQQLAKHDFNESYFNIYTNTKTSFIGRRI